MHSGNLSQIASPNMRLLVQILLIIWFSLIDKNKSVADNFLEILQFFFIVEKRNKFALRHFALFFTSVLWTVGVSPHPHFMSSFFLKLSNSLNIIERPNTKSEARCYWITFYFKKVCPTCIFISSALDKSLFYLDLSLKEMWVSLINSQRSQRFPKGGSR